MPPGGNHHPKDKAVVAPQFDPASGSVMERGVTPLSMTTTTADAEIRYTLDGTEPTESSTLYSAPIRLDADAQDALVTVRAFAVKNGTVSEITDSEYTVHDSNPSVVLSVEKERWNTPPELQVIFSEPVADFSAEDVAITGAAIGEGGFIQESGALYSIVLSGLDPDTITAITVHIPADVCTDAYANPNTEADPLTLVYDPTSPVGVISSPAADPTNQSPVPIVLTFDKHVNDFSSADLEVTNGSVSGFNDTGNPVFEISIAPSGPDVTIELSVPAGVCADDTGNENTAVGPFAIGFDAVRPTVTVNQAESQNDPAGGDTVLFTVSFSEPVTGFTASDIVLAGSAGPSSVTVSGSGKTYTLTVGGMSGDGTVSVGIPEGAAADAAGNTSLAATGTDTQVTYDGTPPSVQIIQAAEQEDPATDTPIVFTAEFSETVTGFSAQDVVFTGSADVVGVTVVGSGTIYTVSVTAIDGEGTVTATIPAGAAVDAVGNANLASAGGDNTVVYDKGCPKVVAITSSTGETTGASPLPVTIVFSEEIDPASFTETDIAVSGSAGALVQSGSLVTLDKVTWTLCLTVQNPGTITVTIPEGVCNDLVGNPNEASEAVLTRTYVGDITLISRIHLTRYTNINPNNYTAVGAFYPEGILQGRMVVVVLYIEMPLGQTPNFDYVVFRDWDGTRRPMTELPGSHLVRDRGTTRTCHTYVFYGEPVDQTQTMYVKFTNTVCLLRTATYALYNVDVTDPFGATAATVHEPNVLRFETPIEAETAHAKLLDVFFGTESWNSTTFTGIFDQGDDQLVVWWFNQYDQAPVCGSSIKPVDLAGPTTMWWELSITPQDYVFHLLLEMRAMQ